MGNGPGTRLDEDAQTRVGPPVKGFLGDGGVEGEDAHRPLRRHRGSQKVFAHAGAPVQVDPAEIRADLANPSFIPGVK